VSLGIFIAGPPPALARHLVDREVGRDHRTAFEGWSCWSAHRRCAAAMHLRRRSSRRVASA